MKRPFDGEKTKVPTKSLLLKFVTMANLPFRLSWLSNEYFQ